MGQELPDRVVAPVRVGERVTVLDGLRPGTRSSRRIRKAWIRRLPSARSPGLQAALQARPAGGTLTQHFSGAGHGFSDSFRHGTAVNADTFALSWPQTPAFLDAPKG
ncbi:hypothetical protein [Amycolatopsis sp. PS_44_ISF1]|uniref:hypothetical protein n=1 Tax=Amycolatopsis sp. PS_44_ISF1 TaxID=2974917 RepID=UPI0028DFE336|nr:hypothetical protein [Amycolatopsis sp. PS_44_ISF1]MDT8912236.1 hypothetical protein [Amycolatopsis sp. PS_44_ISF1]